MKKLQDITEKDVQDIFNLLEPFIKKNILGFCEESDIPLDSIDGTTTKITKEYEHYNELLILCGVYHNALELFQGDNNAVVKWLFEDNSYFFGKSPFSTTMLFNGGLGVYCMQIELLGEDSLEYKKGEDIINFLIHNLDIRESMLASLLSMTTRTLDSLKDSCLAFSQGEKELKFARLALTYELFTMFLSKTLLSPRIFLNYMSERFKNEEFSVLSQVIDDPIESRKIIKDAFRKEIDKEKK